MITLLIICKLNWNGELPYIEMEPYQEGAGWLVQGFR